MLHHARLLVAGEAASAGWGEPEPWLRESLAYYKATGYTGLARFAKRTLRELGLPVPRRGRGDSDVPSELAALGVTSREMDVLHLVADGLGNREIASRLYLSPRTVKSHVASLFRKTGARHRMDLVSLTRRRVEPGPVTG